MLNVFQSRFRGKKITLLWFGRSRLLLSLLRLLDHHPLSLVALALILTLPALGIGLQLDDYLHQSFFSQSPGLIPTMMALFRFLDQNPHQTLAWMEQGILPWWTIPEIQVAFWRPLSALTHWLDYQLWPHRPALMHAQSLLWFGLLIGVVTQLYRQLFRLEASARLHHFSGAGNLAALAALLYTIDEAHGFPVGWLANRNALLATLFFCLTLLTYDRWRRWGWRPGSWLAPLLFLLGLLSAEAAIATLAYLLAHTLFLDKSPWPGKALALLPFAAITLGWQLLYRWLNYGAYGTAYADPMVAPFRYLATLLERGPVLLWGQFFLPPPDFYLLLSPAAAQGFWLVALSGVGLLVALFWPMLRANALARFWATGLLLALPPACVILPAGRLLFFIGLGGMGLMAQFLGSQFFQNSNLEVISGPRRWSRAMGGLFIFLHLMLAPLGLLFFSFSPALVGDRESASQSLPTDPALARQTLIIVSAPTAFYPAFIPQLREQAGQPVPARLRLLASSLYPVEVQRLDERTLQLRPAAGYLWGLETVFRGHDYPLALNQQIILSNMSVQVTALTPDGRPAEVRFQFAEPLEAETWHWAYWQDGIYRPFPLPKIGEAVEISNFTWREE